jgi:predicted Zn-dependent protease
VAAQLAFVYIEHGGDINAALSLALAARQKLPESAEVLDTLGWAYYKLGSARAAVPLLSDATRRAPDNPVFSYHLGMAQLAAGDIAAADQSLRQVLQRTPEFAYAGAARNALAEIAKLINN